MAGMPTSVVLRANEIMHHLEVERTSTGAESDVATEFDDVLAGLEPAEPASSYQSTRTRGAAAAPRHHGRGHRPAPSLQLSMFEPGDPALERIRELLQHLDVNTLTPIEALMKLNELKLTLGK